MDETPPDAKTMFEIYREGEYNRQFRYIFYTELEEHGREKEISRAAAGQPVFSGFFADDRKEAARVEVEAIVDELNELDEDDDPPTAAHFQRRLGEFMV
ncbi:MAG: hypothetical protein B7733_03465 [Myxococcales bacterium FL481]|nr:MAG: hypothetical protein B7733_03465 [Myxococcales bacterium FL481]